MRQSTIRIVFCCWRLYSYVEAAAGELPSLSAKRGNRLLSASNIPEGVTPTQSQADTDVRHGVLFQTNGCPQAITSREVPDMPAATTFPGNTINVTSQTTGRDGNRYEDMSQYFSMAYCCRSSLLVLPGHVLLEEDLGTLNEDRNIRENTYRWYNFSDAKMDLLPEFADLFDRPDVCIPRRVASGLEGYNLVGIHSDLEHCLNHVFVRGCEAELTGSVVNTTEICHPINDARDSSSNEDIDVQGISTEDIPPEDIPAGDNIAQGSSPGGNITEDTSIENVPPEDKHQRLLRKGNPGIVVFDPPTVQDDDIQYTPAGKRQSAGSLVIHIRSGDIFDTHGPGKHNPGFGQPPLEFYLDVIASKAWSDVSIITYASSSSDLNPTYKALRLLNDSGTLGSDVTLHDSRPLLEDIKAMLCADALAVARSSLHFLIFANTRASTFYLPGACGPGQYRRQSSIGHGAQPKKCPDNATLLIVEKPGAEVYGIEWENHEDSYTPYEKWADTDGQMLEMVTFEGVKGLKRCSITD